MVCPRCIQSVSQILEELGQDIMDITLGSVILGKELDNEQKEEFSERLSGIGLELLDDRTTRLINKIKSIIIDEIHYQNNSASHNLSDILTDNLHYDYSYLSRLFSAVEGRTIEKFVLAQKIEKVKELLTYNELTLSEISFQMNYSSMAHLSAQFKKVTGMSPSVFKKLHQQNRKSLDAI